MKEEIMMPDFVRICRHSVNGICAKKDFFKSPLSIPRCDGNLFKICSEPIVKVKEYYNEEKKA
jgi:hypothetical protein